MRENELLNSPFSFVKYYFDCVDEAGSTIICFTSILKWRIFNIEHTGIFYYDSEQGKNYEIIKTGKGYFSPFNFSIIPVSLSSHELIKALDEQYRENKIENGALFFNNACLNVQARVDALPDDINRELYENLDGKISWTCFNANAKIDVSGRFDLQGQGYIEKLQTNIKLWELSNKKYYWGRFTSDNHSLLWIIWEGANPMKVVLFDGAPIETFNINSDGASNWDKSLELKFIEKTQLKSGALINLINSGPDWLQKLCKDLSQMKEAKYIAKSLLTINGVEEMGWSIIEEVTI